VPKQAIQQLQILKAVKSWKEIVVPMLSQIFVMGIFAQAVDHQKYAK